MKVPSVGSFENTITAAKFYKYDPTVAPAVTLFPEAGCAGWSTAFYSSNGSLEGELEGSVGSMYVPKGIEITLFKDKFSQGDSFGPFTGEWLNENSELAPEEMRCVDLEDSAINSITITHV